MDVIHRISGFDVTVKRAELARLLGYGRAEIPDRVSQMIDDIEDRALSLITPACAYRAMRRHDLSHSPYLYHTDDVVLCLVTIGGKLEDQSDEYKNQGDLSRALVLDVYGSAAVEACADAAQAMIESDLNARGLHSSPRFSPGYACWNVKEQEWILPILEGEEIGVRMTEGFMLVPRKSVTFAMTFSEKPVESRYKHSCEVCGMVDCHYKRPA
jgi:hypothetical protein